MSKVSRRSPTTCTTCKRRCRTFKMPSLAARLRAPPAMRQSWRPSSRRCRKRRRSRNSCPEALRYRLRQQQRPRRCLPRRHLWRRHRLRVEEVQSPAAVTDAFSCPDKPHGRSSPLCTTTSLFTISSGHCLFSCSDLSVARAQRCRSIPSVEIGSNSCQPMVFVLSVAFVWAQIIDSRLYLKYGPLSLYILEPFCTLLKTISS
mmetsp:Transcript_24626/g.62756  ORF Transcript_24626/g.62756 Transcript_24626/m.62756 type:complete len:203 (+) Transcript_24626:448-1056(+)